MSDIEVFLATRPEAEIESHIRDASEAINAVYEQVYRALREAVLAERRACLHIAQEKSAAEVVEAIRARGIL